MVLRISRPARMAWVRVGEMSSALIGNPVLCAAVLEAGLFTPSTLASHTGEVGGSYLELRCVIDLMPDVLVSGGRSP